MANIISFIIGLIALVLALIAFIPFIGALNWLILPIVGIGLLFGFISSSNSGRNFNIFVLVVCLVRLWLGGGIF